MSVNELRKNLISRIFFKLTQTTHRTNKMNKRNGMKRKRRYLENYEEDMSPLTGVANLFDAAIVLAVALIITLVSMPGIQEIIDADTDFTMVINPGEDDMQVITRLDGAIEIQAMTGETGEGIGERLGATYRLECGTMIYVPVAGR